MDYPLLNQVDFEDMKFNVVNIKHFFNNKVGFLNHVKAFNPTAIVIERCYSKDGDVANLFV